MNRLGLLLLSFWLGQMALAGNLAQLIARHHLERPSLEQLQLLDEAGQLDFLQQIDPWMRLETPSAHPVRGLGAMEITRRAESTPVLVPLLDGPLYRAGIDQVARLVSIHPPDWKTIGLAQLQLHLLPHGPQRAISLAPGPYSRRSVEVRQHGNWQILRFLLLKPHAEREIDTVLAENIDPERPLLLDFRYAAGGDLFAAIDSLARFIDLRQPLAGTEDNQGQRIIYRGRADRRRVHRPLYLLTGPGTASAGELMVRALVHYGYGIAVGEATYGKCRVQSRFALTGGSAVHMTTHRLLDPEGRDCHQQPLAPHIWIDNSDDTSALVRAIEQHRLKHP